MPEDIILFQPMGRRVVVDKKHSLLTMAEQNGVGIEATCGGKGLCGSCKVQVQGKVSPLGKAEADYLGPDADKGYRLACQTKALEGVNVWVPENSRLHQQVILTTGYEHEMNFDPEICVWELSIPLDEPEQTDQMRERILAQLNLAAQLGSDFQWNLSSALLQGVNEKINRSDGKLSVVTTMSGLCLEISTGWDTKCLGLAVDLGTTTIVAYLVDLETGRVLSVKAEMNPQVSQGEDVISRIALCRDRPDRLEKLAGSVHQCINALAQDACMEAGVHPGHIFETVLVGNTAMHHIFLQLDPCGLAQAPYTPVTSDSVEISARPILPESVPGAQIHVLPVKAGFVGADTVAVVLALDADQVTEPTLVLDLGTNGEIVLATPEKLLCCSCAAGPAFEGGHIKWGLRGAPGAVDQVSVSADSLVPELRVIGDGAALGICGSGLVSLVSELVKIGVVTPSGGFDPAWRCQHLREGTDGWEYLLAKKENTGTGQDLVLTHQDLSHLQLAKAAIHAGISLLLAELGLPRVEKVLLAGAFGNYLDPVAACGINMFPGVSVENITSVGNAAGAGALSALISRSQRKRAQTIARRMDYLELATHPKFNETFVTSMAFSERGDD
ncbi:MAG: ASKHA domain-containing protein [Desulfobacteraceae bacterium]|nr:ASKHA domain-containing protein [Desulfobacteraceae bacterium]